MKLNFQNPKLILIVITLLLSHPNTFSQTANWAVTNDADVNDETGDYVGIDVLRNVYSIGHFTNSMTLGGTTVSSGSIGLFLTKYDESGNFIYLKKLIDLPDLLIPTFAMDKRDGSFYLSGIYGDSIILGNDTLRADIAGYSNIFLAKYDSSGSEITSKTIAGHSKVGTMNVGEITVDVNTNSIYCNGIFRDSLVTSSNVFYSTIGDRIFILKEDFQMNEKYALQGINNSQYYGNLLLNSMITDDNGNLYFAGSFMDTLILGTLTLISPQSSSQMYFVKIDSAGSFIWARQSNRVSASPPAHVGIVEKLSIDADQNIYILGSFFFNIKFNNLTLQAYSNGIGYFQTHFIVKYDSSGTPLWVKPAGYEGYINTMCIDKTGHLYLTGIYSGTPMSIGSTTFPSAGSNTNIFLAVMDLNGSVVSYSLGFSLTEFPILNDLIADSIGQCWLTGSMATTLTFGSIHLTGSAGSNYFLAKFGSLISGIQNISSYDEIFLFPNPVQNKLYLIQGDTPINSVEMIDMEGKIVLEKSMKGSEILDVAALSPGVYFLKMYDEHHSFPCVSKIIKE